MELNQLRYFILTAQLQNMSQASRALNITQPTLSKSIASLEQELGCQLFDRAGRKLILNERGKHFLEKVQFSLQGIDAAVSYVQDDSLGSTLKLGLFLFSSRLMSCLSDFSRQNSDIYFNIEYLMTAPDSIDTNEFDMLLYPRQVSYSKYRGEVIYTEGFYLAVNSSNPLAEKKNLSAADIEGQNLILLKYAQNVLDLPYEFHNHEALNRGRHNITNSHEIQRAMIEENMGVGFVSHNCANLYENYTNIVLLEMNHEGREIMIGFKREKHLNESGMKLARFVREYFGLPYREGK